MNNSKQKQSEESPIQKSDKEIEDIFEINTTAHSQTTLKNSLVEAKKVSLNASDHSVNFIDGTHFKGNKGSVEMKGIGQTGGVDIENASVTLVKDSTLLFQPEKRKL